MMLLKIAWRSLWRNKRRTVITVVSIMLGTAMTLVFVGLQLGVYKKLVDEAVRMNAGHVTVEHAQYGEAPAVDLSVARVPEVRGTAEVVEGVERIKLLIVGQAMASTSAGSAGVGLVGVDPEAEKAASPLAQRIIEGRYLERGDERGVVVGARLAERLKLKIGRKLVVTTNDARGELVSEMLRLTGIFEIGMEEADGFLIQVPLDTARRIFALGPDEVTRVGIVLRSPKYQDEVIEELKGKLDGKEVVVLPWQEVMSDLAGFIAVDVGSNYVFQGFIIFIIGFTILNSILMSVLERTREFATLLAIGTSALLLTLQVVLESALLGILGSCLGLALGGGISWYFKVHGLDLSSLYGEGTTISGYLMDPVLRSHLAPGTVLGLGLLIVTLTLVLGLYPAWKSARISLPDVLRTR